MTDVRDKVVLVTGGARGIGRLMASKLAEMGASVVIWDIDAARLTEVADGLKASADCEVFSYHCDVSDPAQVQNVAAQVKQEVGAVDILVNNAGIVSGRMFLDCSDDQIRRTIEVNTMSVFWTTRAFLPEMIQRGHGHLVTVASAAALVGVSGLADYCASKSAVVAFDEALRMELRKAAPGVKTTVACPYFVDTGMFRGVKTRFPWLLPILTEDYVAKRVVRAILKNRPRVLMPRITYLVPLIRLLPVSLFDRLANFLGLSVAMDQFLGREDEEQAAAAEECRTSSRD